MVPVFQAEDGDCLRACVASILELPLKSVPHFSRDYTVDWFEYLVDFLYAYDYEAYWTPKGKWDYTGNYSIGYGWLADKPGWEHVVVCWNGHIVHDPSPLKLKKVSYYINLESV